MTNIPTELLRTLTAVVDLRSFTKAAHFLGVTQPAVSAQIKRLQILLGRELLDKSAPGVMLTATGELVVGYARRLLQINDQILHLAGPRAAVRTVRLGIPGDFASPVLARTLAGFRTQWPDVCVEISNAPSERLLHDLRSGELDVIVTLSDVKSDPDARFQWTEELVWVRGPSTRLDANGPVPLASCGESCTQQRLAVATLEKIGRSYSVVLTAPNLTEVASAVAAGFGITALSRSRIVDTDLVICDERMLPKLPDIVCSIHVREDGDRDDLESLADALAETLQPLHSLTPAALRKVALAGAGPLGEAQAPLGLRVNGM
jgi:DNA-binding transcriptional LysR family regulator